MRQRLLDASVYRCRAIFFEMTDFVAVSASSGLWSSAIIHGMPRALTFGTDDFRTVLGAMTYLLALVACAFEYLRLFAIAALVTDVAAFMTSAFLPARFHLGHEVVR